ncbi:hypothetical protein F0U60_32430 [Archangium minus]|uniref:Uncharacterized protein n=1 Tax=Archangium minus TaxID=83450 RepID=A0ABY9WYX2_9BACT|nr:hypothetical protein F0U60_32430 [Archangium minus]
MSQRVSAQEVSGSWQGQGVSITGLGLVSALAGDVVTSCAAARAGLSRWAELDVLVSDEEALESVPLKGKSIPWLTEGFEGIGRFIRLGQAALADLLEYSGLDAVALPRTGVLVQLPGGGLLETHVTRSLAALTDVKLRASVLAEFRDEQERARELLSRRVIPETLKLNGLSLPAQAIQQCVFGGPATFVQMLAHASQLLRSRQLDRCIVGGIDSYVDLDVLTCAYELGLVRTPRRPVGFFPGEAAAFVLLERTDEARARGGRIEAALGAMALHRESFHRFSGAAPVGTALFKSMSSCLEQSKDATRQPDLAIVNLNGDEFRARDFGTALVRLAGAGLPSHFRQWYPVEQFGEIGATTGAASICLGVRGFARNYARSPSILVALLDEQEARSAFILENPHEQPGGRSP